MQAQVMRRPDDDCVYLRKLIMLGSSWFCMGW